MIEVFYFVIIIFFITIKIIENTKVIFSPNFTTGKLSVIFDPKNFIVFMFSGGKVS